MDFRALGHHLKSLRQDSGLTMKELGARVGLSYQQIDNIESARRKVPIERLEQIAAALGHRLEVLLVPATTEEVPRFLPPDTTALLDAIEALPPERREDVKRLVRLLAAAPESMRLDIADYLSVKERRLVEERGRSGSRSSAS